MSVAGRLRVHVRVLVRVRVYEFMCLLVYERVPVHVLAVDAD